MKSNKVIPSITKFIIIFVATFIIYQALKAREIFLTQEKLIFYVVIPILALFELMDRSLKEKKKVSNQNQKKL